jgi:hypothetical protein
MSDDEHNKRKLHNIQTLKKIIDWFGLVYREIRCF